MTLAEAELLQQFGRAVRAIKATCTDGWLEAARLSVTNEGNLVSQQTKPDGGVAINLLLDNVFLVASDTVFTDFISKVKTQHHGPKVAEMFVHVDNATTAVTITEELADFGHRSFMQQTGSYKKPLNCCVYVDPSDQEYVQLARDFASAISRIGVYARVEISGALWRKYKNDRNQDEFEVRSNVKGVRGPVATYEPDSEFQAHLLTIAALRAAQVGQYPGQAPPITPPPPPIPGVTAPFPADPPASIYSGAAMTPAARKKFEEEIAEAFNVPLSIVAPTRTELDEAVKEAMLHARRNRYITD